ncbi:MAG: N-6 DNA methylase [Oleispira sp.]|nr:N-6 DNA methylase [Oleispira sp.]
MVNIGKRELLELLEKKTLRKLVDSFELPVRGNASHQTLVDALVAKRSIKPVDDILPEASLSELKAVCTYAELPSSGKKADLLAQLIDTYQNNLKSSKKTTKTVSRKADSPVNKPPSTVKKIVNKAKPNAMFEQTFKNIDDIFHKDAGCSSELDYTEQSSWMLFLKYLDDLEFTKSQEAELMAEEYQYIIDEKHRWSAWAAPKTADGQFDHDNALTGDDLMEYVDGELFPYLKGFKQRAESPNTIEYKIGEIFGEIKNKIQSGYSLRDALEKVDELRFRSQEEKHELSHLYETKIKNMGNAGRNGGEYYTPRPLIRAMIDVLQPKIGDTIYDGAAGSAGFLCEAYDYLRQGGSEKKALSTSDLATLQTSTFYAKEKKSLAYVIAIMNMILHGIEAPNVIHTNTLAENLQDITPSNQHDVVLANPPFGGKERPEVQQNFPIKTGETAFLFLQHFIKMLKPGGRAAIVIKNTFLSNTDNAAVALRKELLENCNLHTVLDCPAKTFLGAGVKTVVLFFTKGEPTQNTWFYQLDPGRSLGKTNPLNDNDLKEFVELQSSFAESEKSWSLATTELEEATWDLSAKNPNAEEEAPLREPQVIIEEIIALDKESEAILGKIQELL